MNRYNTIRSEPLKRKIKRNPRYEYSSDSSEDEERIYFLVSFIESGHQKHFYAIVSDKDLTIDSTNNDKGVVKHLGKNHRVDIIKRGNFSNVLIMFY